PICVSLFGITSVSKSNGREYAEIADVPYGTVINGENLPSADDLPIPEGNEFRGWGIKDSSGKIIPYNFSTKVTQNMTLYPIWSNTSGYIVTYDIGEGAVGIPPVDGWHYDYDAAAKIMSADNLNNEGKVFIGWSSNYEGDTALYYPGDKIRITSDVVLTAQWEDIVGKISLTYYANDGSNKKEVISELVNNQRVTILDNMFEVPEGKYFAGWNTLADGTGEAFEPNSDVLVDRFEDNQLFAQWADCILLNVTANSLTTTYNGKPQTVEGITVDGLLKNHVLEGLNASATGTDVGIYDSLVTGTAKIVDQNENDVTKRYNIVTADGYLNITPISEKLTVTVTGNTASMVYTGSEQGVEGYTSDAPTGVNVTLAEGSEAVAKGTDAGRYMMGLEADDFVVSSTNYSSIEVKVVDGYLDITPVTETLTVTVTGNTASMVYTGSEQSVDGYTSDAPTGVNLVLAEGSEAVAKGTGAGRYMMGLEADDFVASSTNYSSIEVKVVDGYLDITPVTETLTVTVTGNTASMVYTGSEQGVDGYTSDAPTGVNVTLAEGSEAIAKGTDAGRYMMGLEADDFVASSTNYSNIEVKVVDGYLDITPVTETLTVTVTGNTASMVYTGSEQGVDGYTSDAP
ncbi:InlB B-repeat-containing protein, partial [Enterocloster hominis (ex Hitch et al. 2024)]